MKVIANIDHTRFLCEVSIDEIALLNGFRNKFQDGCNITKLTQVNTECNLAKIVATSQFVRELQPSVLKSAKAKLEEAIRNVDQAAEEVTKLELLSLIEDRKMI